VSLRHILLRLDAPLMAFGGVAVDNYGVIEAWPAASLLTGLLGNALGWDRTETEKLQRLQDRLIFAARLDRPGSRLTDFQTADLAQADQGWTTSGIPEGRAGGAGTFAGQHIRYRDYWADRIVSVALRLVPAEEAPDLDSIGSALDKPARPLFIGRKPCLPAAPLLAGNCIADTVLEALRTLAPPPGSDGGPPLLFWPETESGPDSSIRRIVNGRRNWRSGVHGGEEIRREGREGATAGPAR
jgi:CRISPR system Cascade subunit CasD